MQKAISTVAITILFAAIICIESVTPTQKIESAKKKIIDAKNDILNAKSDINRANQDSEIEYQNFKLKQENRIIALEKNIAALQATYETNNKETQPFYITKLAVLEQIKSESKEITVTR